MKRKVLAFLLSVAMVILVLPTMVLAFEFSDMPDDWSKTALESAVENGLLTGADGKLMPRDNLTRAQMAAVINRAFGATGKASLNGYTDVASGAWYYDDMAKAVQMKTLLGSGDKLNPDSNITREEAFVVLARAFKLTGSPETILDMFSDRSEISSWSEDGIASLVSAGYITGSNGRLYPKQNITRAEFAQIMYNLLKHYIKTPGTYSQISEGNIMINAPDITLKDVTVKGDLIIGDGAGDGNIILDNVKVTGRTLVRGGGPDSIKIIGGSELGSVIISKVDGNIRVVTESGVAVEVIYIDDGKDDVIIEGEIGSVKVDAANVPVVLQNAVVTSVTVTAPDANITIESTATVDMVSVWQAASGVDLYIDGTVTTITTEADGTLIDGGGTVVNVSIQGDDCSLNTAGTKVEVGESVSGTTIGSQTVDSGITGTTDSKGELVIPATGGRRRSGSSRVRINAISVTGAGDATTVLNGRTLQISAKVSPDNASNKSVTWSIENGTGSAAIDANGLLTATGAGTVTVRAAAQDGSGVAGILEIQVAVPLTITGYNGDDTDIEIPQFIDGNEIDQDGYYGGFKITGTIEPGETGMVTRIYDKAFQNKGLTSVIIPDSITYIGTNAFKENSLTSVTIPGSVKTIAWGAFDGTGTGGLDSITILDGVESIGPYAFYSNSLTEVTIPDSVTSIAEGAFSLNSLTTITILNGVTSIGKLVFLHNNLTSITIGANVTIGEFLLDYNNNKFRTSYETGGAGTYTGTQTGDWVKVTTDVPVNTISVTGEGDATTVVNGGTLQMSATVTPNDATNKDVTWSIENGTGSAEIDDNGLLKATGAGTVTVRATAQDGSDVVGTKEIEVAVPLTISSYNGDETDIVIPRVIDGGVDSNFEFDEDLGPNEMGIVTIIGNFAFAWNDLTSVIIPDSVITIGEGAFGYNGLTSVNIPDSVTTIGEFAFAENQLGSVNIPDSVTGIGVAAFDGLTQENITLGTGFPIYFVYSEDGKTLEGHIGTPDPDMDLTTLPSEVTTIGEYAFDGYEISSVTFAAGNNIKTIGNYAFRGNVLSGVTIPDSVTSIGEGAFSGNQLSDVTISANATSIGKEAFKGNRLTSVIIPASVTIIGEAAFEGETDGSGNQLQSLTFEDNSSLETIGKDAFNIAFDKDQDTGITIPDSVTTIESNAFYDNGLDNVTLGNNVTSIGRSAFYENNLISIIIPDSVTVIEGNAFYNNNLSSLTLGNSVTSIGDSAFHSNDLTSITIPDSVTSIEVAAFKCNLLTSITIGEGVTLGQNLLGTFDAGSGSNEFKEAYESASGGAGTYTGTQTGPWTKE